jgi:hypothetical protein
MNKTLETLIGVIFAVVLLGLSFFTGISGVSGLDKSTAIGADISDSIQARPNTPTSLRIAIQSSSAVTLGKFDGEAERAVIVQQLNEVK